MGAEKDTILTVDQNKITLPPHLIPEHVSHFSLEAMPDGRLILSPVLQTARLDPTSQYPARDVEKKSPARVVDIRLGRKRARKSHPEKKQPDRIQAPKDDRSREDAFVSLHHFSSRMEAEMIGEILRQSELPYLIQSEDIGIFGPGAAPVPGGAGLVVRRTDLAYARTLLAGLI